MVSPICIHCRTPLSSQSSECIKTPSCRVAKSRIQKNRHREQVFLENVRLARICISSEIPPDQKLFQLMLDALDPDPFEMGHALSIKASKIQRWKKGEAQPKTVDKLPALSYIIKALEECDKIIDIKESKHEDQI